MNLTGFAKDALKEVGNIGSSHSASSLSEILGAKVEITPPVIDVIAGEDVVECVGEEGVIVSAYTFGDDITGTILLFFPIKGAMRVGCSIGNPGSVKELDDVLQEVGRKMAGSFVEAVSDFFGVEVKISSPELDSGRISSIQELFSALGVGNNGVLFFNTALQDSDFTYCHLFFYLNAEDIQRIMNVELQGFEGESLPFSELLGGFEKVFEVEDRVNDFLENVRVPVAAKRAFLRSSARGDFEVDRLKALLERMLVQVGIGEKVSLHLEAPLTYHLRVEGCHICAMVPGGACHTTSTAVGRFFMENLGIGVTIEEIECRNSGGDACVHRIELEQIDAFSALPTASDIVLLGLLEKGYTQLQELVQKSDLPREEVNEALKVLEYYGIVQSKGKEFEMTPLGEVFLTFARNAYPAKEENIEGWDDIAEIEAKIKSRKEHASEPGEKAPWEM
ncbi:chemotaxis protein CheC [Candidatus Pyrohabitans sp.]